MKNKYNIFYEKYCIERIVSTRLQLRTGGTSRNYFSHQRRSKIICRLSQKKRVSISNSA